MFENNNEPLFIAIYTRITEKMQAINKNVSISIT